MHNLDPIDWHRFAHGDFSQPVRVARLSRDLVSILGAKDDRVLIHPKIAPKLVFKHRLQPFHMPLLKLCCEIGTVTKDRPSALSFFLDEQVIFGKIFHMALKTTTERHEIWVATFHKISNGEYTRRLKKSEIIRVQQ